MKYIGYYDINDYKHENRKYILSAVNKMNYISKTANKLTGKTEIVSVANTKHCRFYGGRKNRLAFGELIIFPTIPGKGPVFKRLSPWFTQSLLFLYLLKNAKKDEDILVWHGLGYGNAIAWAKKIKKFKVVLEVEEIYQNVNSMGRTKNNREYRDFNNADKYIFSTGLLNEKLNTENKPYCVIHGTYEIEKDRNVSFNDGKIHVVYAGTFDPLKGGGIAAAEATRWLDENYHVHILGFGSDKDVENMKRLIAETNALSKATVTYDGLLSGEEYIEFLQKCHIGLSTQNPDAAFNDTSFPSKILSYMANGLRVVSIRIPVVELSAIGKDVLYYDKQTPEEIAKAIMSVDLNNSHDSRARIADLDREFCEDLKSVISN